MSNTLISVGVRGMVVSHHIRYGIWGLVSLLCAGLVWLGATQYLADRRALAATTQPAPAVSSVPVAETVPAAVAEKPRPEVVVHVAGAVVSPGVFRLEQGARVSDAITKAGGPLPDGMPDVLNLAAVLGDGEKIYVSTRQEAQQQAGPEPPSALGSTRKPVQVEAPPAAAKAPGGKVRLNSATSAEIDALPYVTPATARAIVAYREQHGPFRSWEELVKVDGVGEATLKRLKEQAQL